LFIITVIIHSRGRRGLSGCDGRRRRVGR
jgi:hypothetical protein